MRTEAACPPASRYLFAQEYFSEPAIRIWQQECVWRCIDRAKSKEYYTYIHWQRKPNEIAIFTLYAYADFAIPKKFDCIFLVDNPREHLLLAYELTQCVHEAWFPLAHIDHGHKHLCVFTFEKEVPAIFQLLHKDESKFSTVAKGQAMLGFCQAADLPAITAEAERKAALKAQYGPTWWEHELVE